MAEGRPAPPVPVLHARYEQRVEPLTTLLHVCSELVLVDVQSPADHPQPLPGSGRAVRYRGPEIRYR
jgi:hypothetical protein